jgi:uncharacterized protein involved in outer membrane biogenesis
MHPFHSFIAPDQAKMDFLRGEGTAEINRAAIHNPIPNIHVPSYTKLKFRFLE